MTVEETIEKILKKLVKAEKEQADIKTALIQTKTHRVHKEAKLRLKTNWKEEGISNEAGRNAYIKTAVQNLTAEIVNLEVDLEYKTIEINALKRDYNYQMEVMKIIGALND